jgi:co-chaperonin GroES (HSP10)
MRSKLWQRGASMGGETLTYIPASMKVRPLRDNIVLGPTSECLSRYIEVVMETLPLEGKVLAIGPGTYPKRYDHPDKHRRTQTWDSKAFLKPEVKVGDIVKLGDGEISNNGFQRFWWGDKLCLFCREADVAGIVESRPAPRRASLRERQLPRIAPRHG